VHEFFTAGIEPEVRHQIGKFPSGTGMFAALFREGRVLRLANVSEYPHAIGFPPHHPPIGSFLGVPIQRKERILGAFYLANRKELGAFTDEDLEMLENFAMHVAFEIDLNPWVRA
jgi:GAF domain-containing protein